MAALTLPRDQRVGLVLAITLHAAVLAALLFTRHDVATIAPPERVSVTISDEVAPTSTSPRPDARPAPDVAPVLGEPAPPAPAPPVAAEPRPPEPAPPVPVRVAQPQPAPRPVPRAQPQPRPVAAIAPRTPPQKITRPSTTPPRPTASARPATPARPITPAGKTAATAPPKRAGGSQIGADFLKGVASAPPTPARGQPAAAIGPAERASLKSSITRQLKPNWSAPQGADADQLVTVLRWMLDADGRLVGEPQAVRQSGITDANRAQASRHKEQAIRAVRLAAPFDLPKQYYAAWQRGIEFTFDRKLSQ